MCVCVCVCVGGAFLLSTGRRYVALWPLLTHAGERKIIISIQHHQDIGVGRRFDLGRGGDIFVQNFLNTGL